MLEMDTSKAIIVIYILASIFGVHLILSLLIFFRPSLVHTKRHLHIPLEVAGDTDHDAKTEFERQVEKKQNVLEYEVEVSDDGVFVVCEENKSTVKYVVDVNTPSLMKEPTTPTSLIEDKEEVYFDDVLTKSKNVPTIIRVKESDQNLEKLGKIHYFIKKYKRMGLVIWGSSSRKTRHALTDLDDSMLVYKRPSWKLYLYYFTGFLSYVTFDSKSVLIISHCFSKKVDGNGRLAGLSKLHQWLSNMFLWSLGPMINHLRKRGIRTYLICSNQSNEKVPAGISLIIEKIPEGFTRDLLESSITPTFETPPESNSPVPSSREAVRQEHLALFSTYDETDDDSEKNPPSISSVRIDSYGPDEKLVNSEVPWQRSFSSNERSELHEPDDTVSSQPLVKNLDSAVESKEKLSKIECEGTHSKKTSVKNKIKTFITRRKPEQMSKQIEDVNGDQVDVSDNPNIENNQYDEQRILMSDNTEEKLPSPVGGRTNKMDTIMKTVSTEQDTVPMSKSTHEDGTSHRSEPTRKSNVTPKSDPTPKYVATSASVTALKPNTGSKSDTSVKSDRTRKSVVRSKSDATCKSLVRSKSATTRKSNARSKSDTTRTSDARSESDTTPKSDPTPKYVATSASVTALKPNTGSKSDTSVKSDTTRKSVVRSKSDATCKSLVRSKSATTRKSNARSKSDTTRTSDARSESDTTPKSDPTPKYVATSASVTALKPNTGSKSDTSVKSDTTRKSVVRSKSDATCKSQVRSKSDTTRKSNARSKSDTTRTSDARSESDTTRKS